MTLTALWRITYSLGLGENESCRFHFVSRDNISFADDFLGGSSRVPQHIYNDECGCRKFHLVARVRCHFPWKGSVHIYPIFHYWSKFGNAIVSASGHPLGNRNCFYDKPWYNDNFANNFVANTRGSKVSSTFSKHTIVSTVVSVKRSSPKIT